MISEFEAYVEAITRDMDETHPVGELCGGPGQSSCCSEPALPGTLSKLEDCASLPHGEAISYRGLV